MITWLNEASKTFLERDYLLSGQTVENRLKIIGDAAEGILRRTLLKPEDNHLLDGFSQKVQSYISKGWISPSTPIWTNFGTDRGLPISCFGSYIDDSIESILYSVAEIGTMSKYGGGTSGYFGSVRSRGSIIKDNGVSNGTKPFLELFQTTSNTMNQGSVRRGYFAGYIDIQHGDILEWLNIRSEGDPIQQITWGVCVPTWWINQMREGDEDKRSLWAKVIQKRFETGLPYISFTDNANNGDSVPECYKGKGLIKASQMCVIGSDRVVTDKGFSTVEELYKNGGNLTLFDNEKVVTASQMRLIENNAEVFKVTLENGMEHTITSYHKLKIYPGFHKEPLMKECKDLVIGDKVFVQTKKGLFGNNKVEDEAYLLGLYQADGTQSGEMISLCIWENDFDLLSEVKACFDRVTKKYSSNIGINGRDYKLSEFRDCVVRLGSHKKKSLNSKSLKRALNYTKGIVPDWIWKSDEKSQWAYIKGLLQADGSVSKVDVKKDSIQVCLTSIDKSFLQNVQLIFNNLGLNSKLKIARKSGKSILPDGKGGQKEYNTKETWRLYVTNKPDCIEIEKNTGFLSRKNVSIINRKYRDNIKKAYKIVSIDYIGREDVYCTTVDSEEHLWICNGFITSNCTEIFLPSGKDYSFVCDLASLNDLYYEDYKDTDCVEVCTFLLDAAMTEFIEKASKVKFLERAVKFAKEHRALGIGRLGYHSLLQSQMISFESMHARRININIQKSIQEQSYEASKKLARMYGECEWTRGLGRRNTTTQAIAPTTSSAFIMQVSQSFEINNSNYFTKDLAKGKFTIKNKYLEALLDDKGKNTEEVWMSILKNQGSVLHLDFISDFEKSVFKTAREVSQEEVIVQAAQRQKYIDQGQSINMFVTADTSAKEVNRLLLLAHDMGIKSLYYQHNVSAASEFAKNLTCTACE